MCNSGQSDSHEFRKIRALNSSKSDFPQRSIKYFIDKLQLVIHFFDTHFPNTDFPYCIPRDVQRYSACLTETTSLSAEKTGASGCSSGVEHNLAKVGVEGSNPFARSSFSDWLGIKIPALSGIFAFSYRLLIAFIRKFNR